MRSIFCGRNITLVAVLLITSLPARAQVQSPALEQLYLEIEIGDWAKARASIDKTLAQNPDSKDGLLARAYLDSLVGKADSAIEDCSKVLQSEPNNIDALSLRGMICNTLRKNPQGREDLKQFLKLTASARDPQTKVLRACAFENLNINDSMENECNAVVAATKSATSPKDLIARGKAELRQYKWKEAIKTFSKLKRANVLAPRLLSALAYCEAKDGNYVLALDLFSKVARKAPDYFANEGAWGWALEQQKKYDEAIQHFNKALQIEGKYVFAMTRRAWCNYEKHNYKAAIQDSKKAIEIDPDDKEVLWPRIYSHKELKLFKEYDAAHEQKNKVESALNGENYKLLVELEPANSKFWYELSKSQANSQKWENALASVNQALKLSAKDADALSLRAWIYSELGEHLKADTDYATAIRLDPKDAWIHYSRGMFYRREKHYAKAISSITNAIKVDPKVGFFYCARGCAEVKSGLYQKAIADCNKALQLNPQRSHPHLSRGEAYFALGKYNLALQDFNKVLQINGDDVEALAERARLYKKLGKQKLAALDLAKVQRLSKNSEADKAKN